MDTQGEDIGKVVHLEFDRTGIGQKFFIALQEQWHKSENTVLSQPPAGALDKMVKEKTVLLSQCSELFMDDGKRKECTPSGDSASA